MCCAFVIIAGLSLKSTLLIVVQSKLQLVFGNEYLFIQSGCGVPHQRIVLVRYQQNAIGGLSPGSITSAL